MTLLILLGLAVIAFAAFREAQGRWRARSPGRRTPRPGALGSTAPNALRERLSDPREAAALLLIQQALYEGQVTPAHKEVIVAMMRRVFGASEADAEGLFSFGRAAAGRDGDALESLGRVLRPVRDRCTLPEMKDLAGMLEQVGETGSPMNERQRALLGAVRRNLRLGEPVAGEDPAGQDPVG